MGFIASVASVEKTSSGLVKTGPGQLCSVILTGGSDAASLILYNNTTNSGTIVVTLKVAAGATVVFTPVQPWPFTAGLYATISGTGPAVYVGYQ